MKKSDKYTSAHLIEDQYEPGSYGRVLRNRLHIIRKRAMDVIEAELYALILPKLMYCLREERSKVLVQDWYKDTQTKKVVRSAVEQVLDNNLPESYERALFKQKCDLVFDVMLDYASHGQKWAA